MRFHAALALGLAASTQASPVPSLFGDLLAGLEASVQNVKTTVTSQIKGAQTLADAVAKLGVTLKTDAAKHGSIFSSNQFIFNEIAAIKKIVHKISWSKQNKDFVNWRTYKGNGVNLGAWLEQEQVSMVLIGEGKLILLTPFAELRSCLVGCKHRQQLHR